MNYPNITKGIFIERNNRFVATVAVDGCHQSVHVKNTGRLKELLTKGAEVWLTCPGTEGRKTKYDLVAVNKALQSEVQTIVNIDSQIPNTVAADWLERSGIFSPDAIIRREVKYKNSRFDIFVQDGERKAFIEVKGVTLQRDNTALFPDAPTERGIKHLNELALSIEDGYEAYALFVIQMKGPKAFSPNYDTHKEFGDALKEARKKGVKILAVDCIVTPDSITADSAMEVIL